MKKSKFQIMSNERRNYFSINYPVVEQPSLNIGGMDHKVIDISEGGIKFYCSKNSQFEVGQEIEAEIIFHDGESVEVLGRVLRVESNEIVLQTSKGIGFERSIKEQRYLIQKYAGWPEESG